jgi:hypothetical protein
LRSQVESATKFISSPNKIEIINNGDNLLEESSQRIFQKSYLAKGDNCKIGFIVLANIDAFNEHIQLCDSTN